MPRVGIIGGLGPESTIDYYRRIIQVWQESAPGSAPAVLIDSLDVDLGIRLVQSDHAGLTTYLAESAERLERAGADFLVMAANTPHIVFDDLAKRCTLPLLSIVEVCGAAAAAAGLRKVGLLGTRFTMEAPLYPTVFARSSIEVCVPDEADRTWLHERYIGELLRGDFRPETRDGVLRIVEKLRSECAIEGLVLGGTELPLLLGSAVPDGIPCLDTTELHVREIVRRLLSLSSQPPRPAALR